MKEINKPGKIPAEPLFAYLDKTPGAKAKFARENDLSAPQLANWRERGVPWHKLYEASTALNMTMEQYLAETGLLKRGGSARPAREGTEPTDRHYEYLTEYEHRLIRNFRELGVKRREELLQYSEERRALEHTESGGGEVVALPHRNRRKNR